MFRLPGKLAGSHRLSTGLGAVLAIAAAGAVPKVALADARDHGDRAARVEHRDDRSDHRDDHFRSGHDHDDHDSGGIRIGVGIPIGGDPQPEPAVAETRVWVDPVYRPVTEQQWVPPVYRTVTEHVWVPDRYEWRDVERYERGRRVIERVQVLVQPGHYEDCQRQELVCAGHTETVEHQELVTPGHWEIREAPVVVQPPPREPSFHIDLRLP